LAKILAESSDHRAHLGRCHLAPARVGRVAPDQLTGLERAHQRALIEMSTSRAVSSVCSSAGLDQLTVLVGRDLLLRDGLDQLSRDLPVAQLRHDVLDAPSSG